MIFFRVVNNPGGLLRRRRWSAFFSCMAAIILAISSNLAAGQSIVSGNEQQDLSELGLEELMSLRVERVYGASRYVQEVTQAPASVSIITSEEIKRFGHRTLADALKSVPGLYVSNDRNYSYLGIRGFARPGDYNTRILVLIDGHRMNDNIYDASYIGNDSAIDIDLIDRVEIIRGPSSSLYGNSAFLGVINIVTKRGRQIDGAEFSGEVGSLDSYKGRFAFGKRFSTGVELMVSGSTFTSRGNRRLYYPEFDQTISSEPRALNDGIAENSDDEHGYNFYGSLIYRNFTFSGALSQRYKNIPTASFGTLFNDGREQVSDGRAYADVKYDRGLGNDVRLTARASYDYYPYYGTYPGEDTSAPGGSVLNKDETKGEWFGTEVQLTKAISERKTLIVGTEFRENIRQFQRNYDEGLPDDYFRNNHGSRNIGVYSQLDLGLLENLILNAGLRYDRYASFGGTLNPRVGLIYNPWDKGTFKLLYGEAFRAPNDYETVYESPGSARTNPDLKPESIRTTELVYEQYLRSNYRFSVSGYHYRIDDLISQATDSDGLVFFDNLSRADTNGIELEIEGRYRRGILARGSYAFQKAENKTTGEWLSNSPRHLGKVNLSVPLYRDKVYGSLEVQYHGHARTLAGNEIDDFATLNATLFSQKLSKGFEVSGSIYNLLNTRYSYPGAEDHLQDAIQQDGRTFRIRLTSKF